MESLTCKWNDTFPPQQCLRIHHESEAKEMVNASCWEGLLDKNVF